MNITAAIRIMLPLCRLIYQRFFSKLFKQVIVILVSMVLKTWHLYEQNIPCLLKIIYISIILKYSINYLKYIRNSVSSLVR